MFTDELEEKIARLHYSEGLDAASISDKIPITTAKAKRVIEVLDRKLFVIGLPRNDIPLIREAVRTMLERSATLPAFDGKSAPGPRRGSSGERFIEHFLEGVGLGFFREWVFPDCRDKGFLRFDFYLPSINAVIEVQGAQHSEPVSKFGGSPAMAKLQNRDAIKAKYAADKGIKMILVPAGRQRDMEEFLRIEFERPEYLPYKGIGGGFKRVRETVGS